MTRSLGSQMFRRRGENLHTIYIFLFLNIAFFFLEYQDPGKFSRLFSFDRASFLSGQFWRVLTYQFSWSGQGWAFAEIRAALLEARLLGETPWAGLARLGELIGVAELCELAASAGSPATLDLAAQVSSVAASVASLEKVDHSLVVGRSSIGHRWS